MNKIFDISFPRCGTTSTSMFLGALGFKACKSDLALFYSFIKNEPLDWSNVDKNDAFGDVPFCIPTIFLTAVTKYPDSKFILTVRPVDDWLRSIEGLLNVNNLQNRFSMADALSNLAIYGRHTFEKEFFKLKFYSMVELVQQAFSKCPERLLITNLYAQNLGDVIMDFVGIHKDVVFPWQNRQTLGRFKLW